MNKEALDNAVKIVLDSCVNANHGLPENVFLMISALIPIVNVDLLILDKKNRILLSRRNDIYYGEGWSIPGGCMRFGETMVERIQKTALNELGTKVIVNEIPLMIGDVIRGPRENLTYPNMRGHNITVLYQCDLPDNYQIDNGALQESNAGYLKWFNGIPSDILKVHDVYRCIFRKLNLLEVNDG